MLEKKNKKINFFFIKNRTFYQFLQTYNYLINKKQIKYNLNLMLYFYTNYYNIFLYKRSIIYNELKFEKNKQLSYRFFFFLKNVKLLSASYKQIFFLKNVTGTYVSNILQLPTKTLILNLRSTIPVKLIKDITADIKNNNWKDYNIKYFNEVLLMLINCFWIKDTKNVCLYFKKNLEHEHFKNHKKFFLFYCFLLYEIIWPNALLLKIKGFKLYIKGKLARGGSVRKKIIVYKKGVQSFSTKNLCMSYSKWQVWTKSGSVGCMFQLFY